MTRLFWGDKMLPLVLAAVVLVAATAGGNSGYAAASASLSVVSAGNVLTASRNNTVSVEISNVGGYLRELDVALTIPPPLVLFGDNHWIRSSFSPKEAIRANLTIFAPASAAGVTLQGSIAAVYKLVGETTPTTETHAISFLVRGWIDMEIYEVTVNPDPATPGTEITVSGNLLNRGVIPAMYANVSLAPDPALLEDSIAPTYVGEVDPNAPAPFSVSAVIDLRATEGKHQATILVYYRDDLQMDQLVTVPVEFSVVSELPMTQTQPPSLVDELMSNQLMLPGGVVVVVLIVVAVYLRRREKQPES